MEQKIYNEYVEILKEELLPAMGCTEPIAVAYAAAVAVQALGEKPESLTFTSTDSGSWGKTGICRSKCQCKYY